MIPKQRRGLLWLMVLGLGVSACHKNPSSNRESRFQGKAKLVQSSDYSNIAIALYEAGQVDSLLQVKKSLYPSPGFNLTGRDLFDHRKRQPVVRVFAQQDGTWEMTAPHGNYIVVAAKEGFGWSYGLRPAAVQRVCFAAVAGAAPVRHCRKSHGSVSLSGFVCPDPVLAVCGDDCL